MSKGCLLTGAEPALPVDRLPRGLLVVQVALHHLRPPALELALLAPAHHRLGHGVDDTAYMICT